MSKILGIIPSRIGSTRLPRKPLADLCGKSLIRRTYESCKQSLLLDEVIVATDSKEIYDHVEDFGGKVEMTGEHFSGTLRMIEVADRHPGYQGYLNIQGDHPILKTGHIDSLAIKLFSAGEEPQVITPIFHLSSMEDVLTPSVVKVVFNKKMEALYFSRNRIPFLMMKDMPEDNFPYWKHLGLYGFNSEALKMIKKLPMSDLEKYESLEQLTWLFNGIKIVCVEVLSDVLSVDVPEDLDKVIELIQKKS